MYSNSFQPTASLAPQGLKFETIAKCHMCPTPPPHSPLAPHQRKKTNTEQIQYSIQLIKSKEKEEIDARSVNISK
jgi:hypothetical protein